MYYVYLFVLNNSPDIPRRPRIIDHHERKKQFLETAHCLDFVVVSGIQNDFMSVFLEQLFFVGDNGVLSAGNLIIIMNDKNFRLVIRMTGCFGRHVLPSSYHGFPYEF